jgi:hypothetical protein
MCGDFTPHEERALRQTAEPGNARRVYAKLRRIILNGRVTGCCGDGRNRRRRAYYIFEIDGVRSAYRVIPAVYADGHCDLRYNKWRTDADREATPHCNGRNVAVFQFWRQHMVLRLYVGRANVPEGHAAADNAMLRCWHGGAGDSNFMCCRIGFDAPDWPCVIAGVNYAKQVRHWARLPD